MNHILTIKDVNAVNKKPYLTQKAKRFKDE